MLYFDTAGCKLPEVVIHRHCGESGAIGAALEALRIQQGEKSASEFIGLAQTTATTYETTTNEETRCYFCKNEP